MFRFFTILVFIGAMVIQLGVFPVILPGDWLPSLLLCFLIGFLYLRQYKEAIISAIFGGVLLDAYSTAAFGTHIVSLLFFITILQGLFVRFLPRELESWTAIWLSGISVLVERGLMWLTYTGLTLLSSVSQPTFQSFYNWGTLIAAGITMYLMFIVRAVLLRLRRQFL